MSACDRKYPLQVPHACSITSVRSICAVWHASMMQCDELRYREERLVSTLLDILVMTG